MTTDQDPSRVAVITGASSASARPPRVHWPLDGHRLALLARRVDRIQALAGGAR